MNALVEKSNSPESITIIVASPSFARLYNAGATNMVFDISAAKRICLSYGRTEKRTKTRCA